MARKRIAERYMAKLGSRKWWVWVIVITLDAVGLKLGRPASPDWVNVVICVSGVYIGVNAVQKLFLRGVDRDKDKDA